MKIKFILYNLILCSILLISCKPDYSFEKGITPPPVIKKSTQIITIGQIFTGATNTPMCWIDSVPFTLNLPTNTAHYRISDVEKQNNNIILVGWYEKIGNKINPCYWENGIIHDLPMLTDEYLSTAIAVKARNNTLYIFGYVPGINRFNVWIVSNGTIINTLNLTLPPNTIIDGFDVHRSTMCLAGNDLFILSQCMGRGQYGYTSVPFYWKIDANNVSNAFLLENPNNVDFTLFSGGDVSATGKVYTAGWYGISPLRTGGIWTPQGRMNLSPQFDIPYDGGYQAIKVDNNNNNLYVRKRDRTGIPKLSIVTPQGQVTEKTFSLPTNHSGKTATIDIQNGIHAVGITCDNSTGIGLKQYAFIDKEGKHIPLLGINTNVDDIWLYRTKIFNQ